MLLRDTLNVSGLSQCNIRSEPPVPSTQRHIWIYMKPFVEIYNLQHSLEYKVFLHRREYILETCDVCKGTIDLQDLLLPFHADLWVALAMTVLLGGILLDLLYRCKKITGSTLILLVSELLEHSFETGRKLSKILPFNMRFIFFLLAGIVLSNGYKGVLIRALILPLPELRLSSVEEAIAHNYTLNFGQMDSWIETDKLSLVYKFCCPNPAGRMDESFEWNRLMVKNFSKGACKDRQESQAGLF